MATTPTPTSAPTPSPQHNQDFKQLLDVAQQAVDEFNSQTGRSKQSLYQLLERTYQFKKQAELDPAGFKSFAKTVYDEKKIKGLGNKPFNKAYSVILWMAFGPDAKKADISRYSTALKGLEHLKPSIAQNPNTVAAEISSAGGVEELVKAARLANSTTSNRPSLTLKDHEEAVLRNFPTHTFQYPGQKGFKLALIHVGDDGTAKILDERPKEEMDDAIEKASKDRYPRLAPIPYIGAKHRQLRVLDPFFPTEISEYREPFVGGGSVFLFLKQHYGNRIGKYWINDKAGDVYRYWLQIQAEPSALVKRVKEHIAEVDGDLERANLKMRELYDQRTSTVRIKAATAFMLTKLWAYSNKDAGSVIESKLKLNFNPLFDHIQRVVHPMLDGVTITNFNYTELLSAPSEEKKTLIFLDPPYDDQERLYRVFMGERTQGATPEQQKEEWGKAHWGLSVAIRDCRHRWIMTHSDTKFFRSRAVFHALSERFGFKYHEHRVFSSMANTDRPEVITCNFKPGEMTIEESVIARIEAYHAEHVVDNEMPVDWDVVNAELGVSQEEA